MPPSLDPLIARLRGRLRRAVPAVSGGGAMPPQDPLLAAGRLLREAREARGLGLRELARETRISTTVLEALEKGWRDRLPESAYLRTMLPLLEDYLRLSAGSLDGALPPGRERAPALRSRGPLQGIPVGLIDVLGTWPGSLLYGVLTLLLVYLLNLQQERLAAAGLLSSRPVPPLPAGTPASASRDPDVLKALPELRPLQRAAAGQALGRLRTESRATERPDLSLGTLELRLEQPTRLRLSSASGSPTALDDLRGRLSLPVLPPFRLSLDPAPTGDSTSVLWRGAPLQADGEGRWRYPPAAGAPRP